MLHIFRFADNLGIQRREEESEMKRISFITLTLCLLITGVPALGAPILSTGDYILSPGETFTIDILISGITTEAITDFSFRLAVEPNSILLPASPLNFSRGSAVPGTTGIGGLNIPMWGPNTVDILATGDFFSPQNLMNGLIARLDLTLSSAANVGDFWNLNFAALDFGGAAVTVDSGSVSVIPIPSTIMLLGGGLIGLLALRRRRS